jgi:uncharacterized damage-inducible protein DinB
VADPIVEAAREILADELKELRHAIEDLSPDDLNRRPAGDGTNSLAVIATHALASTRSWLSVATGAPLPPRDRPAEFRTVADDGFVAWVDGRIEQCLRLLEDGAAFDPTRRGTAPWRTTGADEPVTAAWALLHALSHLNEHVGHAHVTRDLLTGR